jgi:drug/metabolite transporter (DMT)-like permease
MAKITLQTPVGQPKASLAAIWIALLIIYVVWGSTYLAIRFAVETIPPFLTASVRFLMAGSLLFFIRWRAGDRFPSAAEWRGSGILAAFLLLGGNGAVTWAEQNVPSGLTALMVSSAPLWMLLLEALLPGGRKPSRRAIAGIGVGFAGILLLFWPGQGSLLNIHPAGAFALIIATLSWAFGSVFSRQLTLPRSPMMGTAAEMLAGGGLLLLAGGLAGDFGRLDLASISLKSLLGLAYLTLFGSLVAFTAYTWLLRVAPTSLVSTYAYVNPLVALLLGVIFGNESLSPRSLLAAAVILGSVALTTTARSSQPAPASQAESNEPSP